MSRLTAPVKIATLICAGFATFLTAAGPAAAFDRGKTELFAVLPAGATGPEGLAVARNGDVYVATFGFNTTGSASGVSTATTDPFWPLRPERGSGVVCVPCDWFDRGAPSP